AGSLDGYPVENLAFACYRDEAPKPFTELEAGVRDRLLSTPLANFSGTCDQHRGMPLAAVCPDKVCSWPISPHGDVPPTGLWAPPFAGKTVYCVACCDVLESDLYFRTGITQEMYSPRGRLPTIDSRGRFPDKTAEGRHHSVSVVFHRPDWKERRRVTLT